MILGKWNFYSGHSISLNVYNSNKNSCLNYSCLITCDIESSVLYTWIDNLLQMFLCTVGIRFGKKNKYVTKKSQYATSDCLPISVETILPIGKVIVLRLLQNGMFAFSQSQLVNTLFWLSMRIQWTNAIPVN